jgi:hypothetical protein
MTAHDTVLALAAARHEPGDHEVRTTADDLSGRYLREYIHVDHGGVEHVGHLAAVYHYRPTDGTGPRVVVQFVGNGEDTTLDVPGDTEVVVPELVR